MTEVRWTPQAADDLQAIHDYIARDSPRYALAEAQRILAAIDELVLFPDRGRIVPEHGREDLRELVIAPYRIVCRRKPDVALVLTIFRASRLLPGLSTE